MRDIVRSTFRGLFRPLRLVPTLLVAGALLYAQVHYSARPHAALVGVCLSVAFFFAAPLSYRCLVEEAPNHRARGFLLYSLLGPFLVVATVAFARAVFDARDSFLEQPASMAACVALFWVGGFGLGRDIAREEALVREQNRSRALEEAAVRAQLFALQRHLDPHFLFNTLNAIAEWCHQDAEVAEAAILKLSGLLRTMLTGIRASAWPLEHELQLVRSIFDLYNLRDAALFELVWEVREEAAWEVPPLFLLPLVENALTHGPAKGHRGRIRFSVHAQEKRLSVSIQNPGTYTGPRDGGEGLAITTQRLRLEYRNQASLAMSSDTETTTARIEVVRDHG